VRRRRWLPVGVAAVVIAAVVVGAPPSAQPQKEPAPPKKAVRIGVLYPGADNAVFRGNFNGFRETLAEAGYVEGRNLALDVRTGDGRELARLTGDLTKVPPDLLFAVARSATVTIHGITSKIPVLAIDLESDPVASGFVKTLPRPGGNITGVFMDFPELAGKWLEILKGTVPTLARVAVLWDPATGAAQLDAARRGAQILNLTLHPVEARTTAEIEVAFRDAMRERPNGMIVLTSPILNSGRRSISEQAAHHRLPTLMPFPGYAHDGGLVAYGPDVKTMYAQAATLAVKILGGQPPAMIPVERPTRFTLSFNLKTARTLGITIPPALLARAEDVID
jgi:putative tryptophan/tyrosine transport system substrate-binding protein